MDDNITLLDGLAVSRETNEKLHWFAREIKRWQAGQNLVSPHTVGDLWRRHILDSAQIVLLGDRQDRSRWLDLGSGAGLPGMVIAILLSESETSQVALVESNHKKCAFLRHCINTLDLNTLVVDRRLESLALADIEDVDVVTARALTDLSRLLDYAKPWLEDGAIGYFHKGQRVDEELKKAAQDWQFDAKCHRSLIDHAGAIIEITNVRSIARS